MVSTRSSPVKAASSALVKPQAKAPEASPSTKPLMLFILPKDTESTARFLLLDHPKDEVKRRFFYCPKKALYGFTKIGAPSIDPRSILFAEVDRAEAASEILDTGDAQSDDAIRLASVVGSSIGEGYINKAAEFYVAAPFDLAFILLPIVSVTKGGKNLFQPLDDILEEHIGNDRHLRYILRHGRSHVEEAMERFCDSIDAGDEKMYRYSESKVLQSTLDRAERAVVKGLPASLEEKFVKRGLEMPVLSIKCNRSSVTVVSEKEASTDEESFVGSFDSQSTAAGSTASAVLSEVSSISTTTTVVEDSVPADICHLQRLRTALNFIMSSYLPTDIAERLSDILQSQQSPIDFKPLNEHLKMLAGLRAEALASRSVMDYTRKRGNMDDDEEAELRAEKKRKMEEEEKRKKAGESRGVKNLKKANIQGMQKLSAFFTKQPAKVNA